MTVEMKDRVYVERVKTCTLVHEECEEGEEKDAYNRLNQWSVE